MTKLLNVLCGFLFSGNVLAEVLEQVLTDRGGTPLAGILVRAQRVGEEVVTRADAEGRFRLELEGGPWWVQVDDRELLERGYFCVPGTFFPGPGSFIQAVNLFPDLSLKRAFDGAWIIDLDFDWLENLDPVIARRSLVERSEDGVVWESLGTVLLTNPPIRIVDPKAEASRCFYRARDAGGLQLRPITWQPGFSINLSGQAGL